MHDLTSRAPPLSHLIFTYEAETWVLLLYLLFTKTNTYLSYNLRSAANRIQEVMSPGNSNSTMSAFSTNNPDTMTLAVPKLHDDGSNWADYEPCIQRALGLKGLWRHIEGTAIVPKPYVLVTGVPILMDGTTQAMEDQIKARETKIIDYDKREYLAQHVILSMTSTRLGNKIKNLKASHDMWDVVKVDAMTKSTLVLLDTEDQLASMKLAENNDPKVHLTEVKQHFQLMGQQQDNLLKMGSMISNSHYNTIIMSLLPESYWPTLQTITAAEWASTLLGTSSSRAMKPNDLITFITEEAQHRIINDECTKNAESMLAALGKKQRTGKHCSNKGKEKSTPGVTCKNCKNAGHTKANCWAKGGGKEGQGDETPRKEKRRRKQLQQWKRPAMPMKYSPLPAHPTTLKSQTLSTFPNPDLVHASTVAQVNITAPTTMRSSITLQSITPPSQLLTVANSKPSEKATCGSSYWMAQSAPRPYSRRQYMPLTWHLLSSR